MNSDCRAGELSQEINIIGQELRDFKARRVAVYLPNSVELMNTVFGGSYCFPRFPASCD